MIRRRSVLKRAVYDSPGFSQPKWVRRFAAQLEQARQENITMDQVDLAAAGSPVIGIGPDKSICGQPIDWKDRISLDPDFIDAARKAIAMPEFDIGLVQWSPEDPLIAEYEKYWNKQRTMLRKWLAVELGTDAEYVVHRRVDDGDGVMKGYVRVEPGEKS